MSRNHGHGESLFHHIKIIFGASWSFLWPRNRRIVKKILPITVKQQIQTTEILTSTRQIPTEQFGTQHWIDILGGVRVYTATDWHLTKSWTIHHHTLRHPILWTLCWLDRKAPILKIPQNSIWTSYVIDDTDQRTTTFPEKYEPRSTLICTVYADNNTTTQELHEYSRDHRVSA